MNIASATIKSVVFWLIVVNAAIYGYMATLPDATCKNIYLFYGLSRIGLENGSVWQFFTYGFIHYNVWHLAANMLGLFFLGRLVERALGGWRFSLLYLLALVGGGVGQLLLAPHGEGSYLIGASGAVCGVIAVFSAIYRDSNVVLLLFFVLPIPLRGRYLGWLVLWFSFAMVVLGWQPEIGHAAHFAGCVVGYLYAWALGFGPRARNRRE